MPDASTNTPFIAVLTPLSCLDATTVLEKLDQDSIVRILDDVPLKDLLAVGSTSKDLCLAASHRLSPVLLLRADPYAFSMAEILLGQAIIYPRGNERRMDDVANLLRGHRRDPLLMLKLVGTSATHLGDALSCGSMPALQVLSLGGNQFGDAGLAAFGSAAANGALASLRFFDVNTNSIGPNGIKAFCKPPALAPPARTLATPPLRLTATLALPNLETFHLTGNPIGDEGAAALEMAVRRGAFPTLRTLSVGNETKPIGEEALLALQAALPLAKVEQIPLVNLRDLELVMSQAGTTSRMRAATALKNNDGDIVCAIMELTM
jgi:hypothetical protein